MKVFDIENYGSKEEREQLAELEITSFCKAGDYLVLSEKDSVSDITAKALKANTPILLKDDSFDRVCELCSEYPDIVFIVGGFFSCRYDVFSMSELLEKYPKVYLNLSGTFSWTNYYLHELLKHGFADRILFATAFPFANPAYKKATVLWESRDICEEDKEKIMHKNAERLFRHN